MSVTPRLIPDAECVQGKCGCTTTGCWDECAMKHVPVTFATLRDTRIADLETALRAAQATIGGLMMEVAGEQAERGSPETNPALTQVAVPEGVTLKAFIEEHSKRWNIAIKHPFGTSYVRMGQIRDEQLAKLIAATPAPAEQHVIASQSAAPVAASDAPVQPTQPSKYGSPELQGLIVQHASGSAQPADSYDAAAMDRQYLAGYDAGFMAGEAGDDAKRAAVQTSRSRSIREARATQAATVTGEAAEASEMVVELLPLPEANMYDTPAGLMPRFTASQMRSYAAACSVQPTRDAVRLDFIAEHPEKQLRYHKRRWALVSFTNYEYDVFKTPREAIDAAIKAMAPGEKA